MIDQASVASLMGSTVRDNAGEKIGKVRQVYLDDTTGQPEWVTVHTGLFGTKESFVPLAAARVEDDDLVVDIPKSKVREAPQIDEDGHLSEEQETELYTYYGVSQGPFGRQNPTDAGPPAEDAAFAGTAAPGTIADDAPPAENTAAPANTTAAGGPGTLAAGPTAASGTGVAGETAAAGDGVVGETASAEPRFDETGTPVGDRHAGFDAADRDTPMGDREAGFGPADTGTPVVDREAGYGVADRDTPVGDREAGFGDRDVERGPGFDADAERAAAAGPAHAGPADAAAADAGRADAATAGAGPGDAAATDAGRADAATTEAVPADAAPANAGEPGSVRRRLRRWMVSDERSTTPVVDERGEVVGEVSSERVDVQPLDEDRDGTTR